MNHQLPRSGVFTISTIRKYSIFQTVNTTRCSQLWKRCKPGTWFDVNSSGNVSTASLFKSPDMTQCSQLWQHFKLWATSNCWQLR